MENAVAEREAKAPSARPAWEQRPEEKEIPGGNSKWDVVIVGGGVAGCALAKALGDAGRSVMLLERSLNTPDRIVGELLQPGGVNKLHELGLGHCTEGIDATDVQGYCMYKNGQRADVSYPQNTQQSVHGRSFHNGRFVQQLRHAANACESVYIREATASRLLHRDSDDTASWHEGDPVGGVMYKRNYTEHSARAHLTVLCDGMYSNFRSKLSTTESFESPSHFVGLILHKSTPMPKPNHACVVLGDPSPVLFYPISPTEVRCLVDVPGSKLPSKANGELARYLREHVAPQLPDEFHQAFLHALENGDVRSMPNKAMYSQPARSEGAVLLGDSFNMRHPLTGGGMTVALHDVALLASSLEKPLDLSNKNELKSRTEEYYLQRKPWAATINTLANALYKVFCSDGSVWREEMRKACFDYLRLGGSYSNGPISLLGGLNTKPSVLVSHFFMVALYGVGRVLLPVPSPRSLFMASNLLTGASLIICPLLRAESSTAPRASIQLTRPHP